VCKRQEFCEVLELLDIIHEAERSWVTLWEVDSFAEDIPHAVVVVVEGTLTQDVVVCLELGAVAWAGGVLIEGKTWLYIRR